MATVFKNKKVMNAIYIGTLCSVSYLAVYFARNMLSAITPQMTEGGLYSEEFIGDLSSLYFIFYAVGQFINGLIGDRIKAKYMISFGLIFSGVCSFVFPIVKTVLPSSHLLPAQPDMVSTAAKSRSRAIIIEKLFFIKLLFNCFVYRDQFLSSEFTASPSRTL